MEQKFLRLRNQIEAKRDEYCCCPGIERQIDEELHEEGEKEDEMGEPEAEVDNEFDFFRVGHADTDIFQAIGKEPGQEIVQFFQPPKQMLNDEFLNMVRTERPAAQVLPACCTCIKNWKSSA
jgi:hypothetical protein